MTRGCLDVSCILVSRKDQVDTLRPEEAAYLATTGAVPSKQFIQTDNWLLLLSLNIYNCFRMRSSRCWVISCSWWEGRMLTLLSWWMRVHSTSPGPEDSSESVSWERSLMTRRRPTLPWVTWSSCTCLQWRPGAATWTTSSLTRTMWPRPSMLRRWPEYVSSNTGDCRRWF